MEPECPLCGVRDSQCKCDPKDKEIQSLRDRVRLLEDANRGWRERYGTTEPAGPNYRPTRIP